MKKIFVSALTLAATLALAPVSSQATTTIKAVGTWGNLTNYTKHEGPFWNEYIAEASKGEIVGDIKPQTELGLKGFEIMRLVKNGVFDFAFGLPGYVASENPIFEGVDLATLTQDIDTQRKVSEVFFPALAEAFESTYNAKLMQLYPFPSQTLWCNAEVNGLADLKDKKVRVYTTTLGDFVEGVGGVSVTVPFAEVIPALEKGVVDCAITGTMSAYKAKWYQVATHAYTLRVGWGIAFGAINLDKWNKMPAEHQAILQTEIDALTDRMWTETALEDEVAINCITGKSCDIGEMGSMTLVEPSEEDLAERNRVASEVIVPRWAARCGSECANTWNGTVGTIVGFEAKSE